MKWTDKREMLLLTTFHDNTMQTQTWSSTEVSKPKCIRQYNLEMGGVDLAGRNKQENGMQNFQAINKCSSL